MSLNSYLILSAFLFCTGIYGVLARKNAVLVLMSIELMLNAVNINLVAFSAFRGNISGQVFALFVITIAAAEVGEKSDGTSCHAESETGAGAVEAGMNTILAIVILRREDAEGSQNARPVCLGSWNRTSLAF